MSSTPQTIHAEAGLYRKLVLFAELLEIYLAHFPSCHKYALSQQIRLAYLDVFNLVTEVRKRYHKKTALTQLDVRHEQLRMMINLAYELGLFGFTKGRDKEDQKNDDRFMKLSARCDEIGRMIGGWIQKEIPARRPGVGAS